MNQTLEAGSWDLAWDGRTDSGRVASTGLYLIKIQAAEDTVVRKVLRVR
jgi:hypothetical protein